VIWTAPTGHIYRTEPGSKLLIPTLCAPTGTLNVVRRHNDSTGRGAMMPRRQRTRTVDRHRRILAERRQNSLRS